MADDADNSRLEYSTPGFDTGFSSGGVDFAAFGRSASTLGRDAASWVGKAASDAGPGAIGAGAGTVLSFMGSMVAARQAKKAAAYNAEVIRRNSQAAAQAMENEAAQHIRNASIAINDVFLVRQSQQEQERAQRQQQEHITSQTRAIIGSSGLMMRGSPIAVMEANMRQSERQILAGRYTAELRERALRDQATMEGYAAEMAHFGAGERLRVGGAQGALARYGGKQQAFASTVEGLGSLASGSARAVAAYEKHQYVKRGGSPFAERSLDETVTKAKK